MKNNLLNKVYYGTYLVIVAIGVFANYMRDSGKKLPNTVIISLLTLDIAALAVFITAGRKKIAGIIGGEAPCEDCVAEDEIAE